MAKQNSDRSLITLILLAGLVIIPLIFILGIVAGSEIQSNTLLTTDSLSSWVTALATVAIATLTFILAKETWYLREAQIEQINSNRIESIRPDISVKLMHNQASFNLIDVEVSNLGKGIARNINFKFMNKSGNEIIYGEDAIVDQFLNLHIFSNGISSLGITQKISSYLFSFFELKGKLGIDDIFTPYLTIVASYSDIEGNEYFNELIINFAEFKGISEIGGSPLHSVAKDLEKLRKLVEKMSNGSSTRLNINSYDSKDRDLARKENEEMLAEIKKQ